MWNCPIRISAAAGKPTRDIWTTPRKRKMQAWDSPALFGRVKSPLRSEKSLRFFRLRLQGVTHYTLPCKEPCARRSLWTPLWQVLRPAILRLAASDKRTAA